MNHIDRALQVAAQAFEGGTDYTGQPAILHPLRVMLEVFPTEETRVAALLEDVTDKTHWSSIEKLAQWFPMNVVQALQVMNHEYTRDVHSWAERLATNPLAWHVKRVSLQVHVRATSQPLEDEDTEEGKRLRVLNSAYRNVLEMVIKNSPNPLQMETYEKWHSRSWR